jgi:hypothetical protein
MSNIKNPSEQYIHDKNCDCIQMIHTKINNLQPLYKDCKECKNVREQTLLKTDDETYLYGDLFFKFYLYGDHIN